MIIHPIAPVFDSNSKILILGSFPSVKSREEGFFYGHKQNRFFSIISRVLSTECPKSVEEKKTMLLLGRIALWDVIRSCEIDGSADSSIKNVIPNDLGIIFKTADIKAIFLNGRTAEKYYKKYINPVLHKEAICLPSTSAANAVWSKERLLEKWLIIKEYLE